MFLSAGIRKYLNVTKSHVTTSTFSVAKLLNIFLHAMALSICKCRENVVPLHCR